MNKYKKDDEFSYSFGAFPTFELLTIKPETIQCILISEKLNITEDIQKNLELAKKLGIPVNTDEKQIRKITDKDNIFIVGVFKKYKQQIQKYILFVPRTASH